MPSKDQPDADEFDVGDIQTAPPMEDLEFEITESDDSEVIDPPPITLLAQTSSVWIYDATCASGATTSFAIPITAYGWHTRLGYFRANGARIGLSPIFDWNRSFYAGSRPSVRFRGRLPAGTKDLRAFWWYDGSSTWWNKRTMTC